MPASAARITASDRLGFTLFLALAIHALILFGIGFTHQQHKASADTLAVTLAYHPNKMAPKHADFMAQSNQQGSGSLHKKRPQTTDQVSPFKAPKPQTVNLTAPATTRPHPGSQLVITSISHSSLQRPNKANRHLAKQQPLPPSEHDQLRPLSERIATLQAQLANEQQAYAKRPRIRFVDSASTVAGYQARYINQFRNKVEAIGTRNFPSAALKRHIFGEVRLRVDILPSGHVKQIKLLHSSGHRLLDQAAMKSVRLAAPFKPFTQKMRQHFDVLAIIRTWKFDASSQLSTSYHG